MDGPLPPRAAMVTLNDGNKMPAVGLGTFQGNYDYSSVYDMVVQSTKTAIDLGYRHFDTAAIYNTEKGVGDGIRAKIQEGKVTRDEIFVTTKLWCGDHRRDHVVPALRKCLEVLGFDYVNMFLVHWPVATAPCEEGPYSKDEDGNVIFEDDKTSLLDTWKGMEECKRLGLAKSIGISNFNRRQLQLILDNCEIKPANHQVEIHVFHQNFPLVEFNQTNGIVVSCFSPLAKPSRSWAKDGDPSVFTDEILQKIAKKYNKTPAQIALKYQVQRGLVVVPKSNTPTRINENINIFDFSLTDEDMAAIKGCDQNFRVLWLDVLRGSKEYPFNEGY